MRLGINAAGFSRIAQAVGGLKVVDILSNEKGAVFYFSDGCVLVILVNVLSNIDSGENAFLIFDSSGKPLFDFDNPVSSEEQVGGAEYSQAIDTYHSDPKNTEQVRDQETPADSSWFQVLEGYVPRLQEYLENDQKEKHEQENEGYQQENEEYERPENVRM